MAPKHARPWRRLGATLTSAFALTTYLVIGGAVPGEAATCGWNDEGTAFIVTLDDVNGSYTFSYTEVDTVDVASVCGGSPVPIPPGKTFSVAANFTSNNQIVTITNWAYRVNSYLQASLADGTDELHLQGSAGDDSLSFSNLYVFNIEVVQMEGMAGNDTLIGSSLNDTILGGAGSDTIAGGDGDDVIDGGTGADNMDGGNGTVDTLSYASAAAGVTANPTGGEGGDTAVNFEALAGSANGDTLSGTSGADQIYGGGGNDTIKGGRGADTLYGGSGDEVLISGGAGDDRLYGDDGDFSTSIQGADTLNGDGGSDVLHGEDGDDTLLYGGGTDSLQGDAGMDICEGYVVGSAGGTKKYGRVSYSSCEA